MKRDTDNSGTLWFSASDNGAVWGAPVKIPQGGGRTGAHQALALDGQGRGAIAAKNDDVGACGGPLLARSTDLLAWTSCSPDPSRLPSYAGDYVSMAFTKSGTLYLAFQYRGNDTLGAGVVLWREQ